MSRCRHRGSTAREISQIASSFPSLGSPRSQRLRHDSTHGRSGRANSRSASCRPAVAAASTKDARPPRRRPALLLSPEPAPAPAHREAASIMDRSRACPCLNVRFTLLSAPADHGAAETSTSTATSSSSSPPRVRVVTSAPQAEHSSLLLASHDTDSGLTTLRCLNCGMAPLRYASRSADLPSDGQAMLSTACIVRRALACGASDARRTARRSSAPGSIHTSRQP